jgi:hypothetical protein
LQNICRTNRGGILANMASMWKYLIDCNDSLGNG